MGMYLDGSYEGGPTLPRIGKALTLVESYGAKEISRAQYESYGSFGDFPKGWTPVIVLLGSTPWDAALVVDHSEWRQLRHPGALELSPLQCPRFLLVPHSVAAGWVYQLYGRVLLASSQETPENAP